MVSLYMVCSDVCAPVRKYRDIYCFRNHGPCFVGGSEMLLIVPLTGFYCRQFVLLFYEVDFYYFFAGFILYELTRNL